MRPPFWIRLILLLAAAAVLAGCATSTMNAPVNTAATYLREAGVPDSSIRYETDSAALIARVRDGRADALAYPLLPARALLARYDGDPDRFEVVRQLEERDMYFAFNRNVSPIVARGVQPERGRAQD